MKKKHLIVITTIALIIGIGILVYKSLGSIDQIIQTAVEKYGSEMTKAEVRLADVTLDFKQGQATLIGLYIGNPEGYQTEYAMKLDKLKVSMDLGTITSDTILIKEVLVQSPDLIYEKINGVSNFDALSNNINAYTGGEQKDKAQDGSGSNDSGTNLIIEDLYVNDGKVGISYKIMQGKTMTVGLPDIHLEDIGKDDGGASPGEVAGEVMRKITSGIGTALGGIKEGAGKVLEKGKEGLKDMGDKLKGLF